MAGVFYCADIGRAGSSDRFRQAIVFRGNVCRTQNLGQAFSHRGWPGDGKMAASYPTVFAMRRPVTTMMMVVALVSGGILAYSRMRVDVFPSLNVPKIYAFLDCIGMSADQMEGFIVSQLELYFQYVDGIKDISSRNIQQVALCELAFFPCTDLGQAMAQVVAMSNRAMSWMPKGTLPPMIMRMDAGSIPVGYLVLESKEASLGQLGDWAQNLIRPQVQKNVPGTVAISPFGPNMRSIVIRVDPRKLRDYNLKRQQVVDALAKGNTIIPAGTVYVNDSMPAVANNATVDDVQRRGTIPLRVGLNVYLRDVATIEDATDINYGYALVYGRKSVYLPVIKTAMGSTLAVVDATRKSLNLFHSVIRKQYRDKAKIGFQFDESPTVLAAIESLATEGVIGAVLTGLMVLLFLGDFQSAFVVVSNSPLALLGSVFGLRATGNTINIMSLGGMALTIGILVAMATVTIENLHVQMRGTSNLTTAMLRANVATGGAILLTFIEVARECGRGDITRENAIAAVLLAAYMAATALHAVALQDEPEERHLFRAPTRSFAHLADLSTELAARDAFTAAVDASDATGYPDDLIHGAIGDYERLLRLKLGNYPRAGKPVDPSPAGPLGRLWPEGHPRYGLDVTKS
jgi:multidrug efflux pump subunit AcrB